MQRDFRTAWGSIDCILANQNPKMNDNGSAILRWYALKVYFNKVSDMEEMLGEENVECYVPYLDQVCAREEDSKKRQVAIPSLMFFTRLPLRPGVCSRWFAARRWSIHIRLWRGGYPRPSRSMR